MRPPPSLASAQRFFRLVTTAPGGVVEGLRDAGDADGARLRALVRGDRELPPERRLGVYAHAFFERLRGALARDFELLAAALGDAAFHDLVKVYLMLHPPRRPSLRDAGAQLASFLTGDEVAAPFRRVLPCAADLAAFEWAQVEVFDAPERAPLRRDALAALPPDAWPGLRLAPVPALRLLTLARPVHEVATAAARCADDPVPERAGAEPAGVRARDAIATTARALPVHPTPICVWRRDERVRWRALDETEAAAMAGLVAREPFGLVCERVAALTGDDAAPERTAALLARWLQDELVAADTTASA